MTIARAGMFAGVMSPTRPWFEYALPDPDLTKFKPVKMWLRQVERIIRNVFNASNLYSMAPTMLGEHLLFGTGCMLHTDDEEDLARFFTQTIGSYYIGQDDKFRVNTLVLETMMTVEQMAMEFGKDKLSISAKNALDKGNLLSWFPVTHIIEPNDEFRHDNPMSKFKKFKSVKYETANEDKDVVLSEKGFDEFPAYCPRWTTTGEDIYGTDSPGMVTLGDIKQLQIQEKRKAQGIDKQVNPPLTGPASVRNKPISGLPGGVTIYDAGTNGQKLESLYNVAINLGDLREDITKTERRIDAAWFVDLFLAITNMEGIQPRNQLELSERNAERLLQLGPVLEGVQGDFLDLLLSRTFNQAMRAGILPEAPQEIQGQELEVNYVSSLAQAQRAVDTKPIERLTEYQGGLVAAGLSDGKKFNGDKAVEQYADLIGAPPDILVSDEEIAEQREAEAQAQAQQQNLEAAEQMARATASAGQTDLSGDNPVSRMVNSATEGGQ